MVVLILVLAMCAKPKGSDSDVVVNANATESTQATEEAYQVDANENINALITQYYTAYAAGDVTTLSSIATPISANEQSYIGLFSQYVDEYQNIKCYTKTGLDAELLSGFRVDGDQVYGSGYHSAGTGFLLCPYER